MYTFGLKEVERYHLRILILRVPFAPSFVHIRGFDADVYSTFRDAYLRRGPLSNDAECKKTFKHVFWCSFLPLIKLSSMILTDCESSKHENLWRFQEHIHGWYCSWFRSQSSQTYPSGGITIRACRNPWYASSIVIIFYVPISFRNSYKQLSTSFEI